MGKLTGLLPPSSAGKETNKIPSYEKKIQMAWSPLHHEELKYNILFLSIKELHIADKKKNYI